MTSDACLELEIEYRSKQKLIETQKFIIPITKLINAHTAFQKPWISSLPDGEGESLALFLPVFVGGSPPISWPALSLSKSRSIPQN